MTPDDATSYSFLDHVSPPIIDSRSSASPITEDPIINDLHPVSHVMQTPTVVSSAPTLEEVSPLERSSHTAMLVADLPSRLSRLLLCMLNLTLLTPWLPVSNVELKNHLMRN